jgi:DNA-binding response OmpR family regulator
MARLLIIDDDKQTSDYLKEFFTLRKCDVSTALSGEEGLLELKRQKPDIVLLDVKMVGMDGLEVLKEIKKIDKNIKVIMTTVASDEVTRQKAKELGADDFIKKPLNIGYLESVVSLKVSKLTKEKKGES